MNEVYPIAAVTLMYIDFFLLLIVKPFFFSYKKTQIVSMGESTFLL